MRNLDNQKDLIIMSVTRPGLSLQDQKDMRDSAIHLLNTSGYFANAVAAEGRFYGESELSIVAVVKPGEEDSALEYALSRAYNYGQDTILLRQPGNVWLVDTDNQFRQRIGSEIVQHNDLRGLPDNCTILHDVVWVVK